MSNAWRMRCGGLAGLSVTVPFLCMCVAVQCVSEAGWMLFSLRAGRCLALSHVVHRLNPAVLLR